MIIYDRELTTNEGKKTITLYKEKEVETPLTFLLILTQQQIKSTCK